MFSHVSERSRPPSSIPTGETCYLCRMLPSHTYCVDIHTHTLPVEGMAAVYNLPAGQLEEFLQQGGEGCCSSGVHPWEAHAVSSDTLDRLHRRVSHPRIVAIGECGLDKRATASMNVQQEIFARQARFAEEAAKPLLIHCVGCFHELLRLRKEWRPTRLWIIHGFRGKPQLARQLLQAGCALSFGERFNPESVRVTPLDRLFVETDESRLPIDDIYARVARAKRCRPDELLAGKRLLSSLSSPPNGHFVSY